MTVSTVTYSALPKRLTAGTTEPQPGQPAYDVNNIDDFLETSLVPAFNTLVGAVREAGSLRWEKVDARASAGRAGALRGDPGVATRFGNPPKIVEWVIDVGQATPTNFWEAGRVVDGVTYPGDYAIEVTTA